MKFITKILALMLILIVEASATNGYSLSLRQAKANAITTAVGNAGILTIYSGTQPATGGTATTVLATFTLGSPFAAAATGTLGGTVSISPTIPATVTATGTGTATWYRITTAGATQVIDGTISATGGGGDLQLATTSITVGLQVQITSWTMSVGNP